MSKKILQHKSNTVNLLFKGIDAPREGEFQARELIAEVIAFIKRYAFLSDSSALATALWIFHTWCYEYFERSPLLLINAPERACGKTQLLKLIKLLAFAPLETANISTASLFRIINEHRPTLLIDEADTFMKGKDEMAGIINNGYEKGGYVLRMESDAKSGEQICCAFQVFGPKALAGIALERHLPSATMSRGIQVPMKRKTKDDTVQRLRSMDKEEVAYLRSGILRFIRDNALKFESTTIMLPEQLGDREQDCWEPLLTIAHLLGHEWGEKATAAALLISAETEPPKSSSNQLLEDIREVLQDYQGMYIASAQLLELLHNHLDMDWCRYNHGQPLSARQLAKFLAPYEIKPKTVRVGPSNTPKGYEMRHFFQAFERYLPVLLTQDEMEETPIASSFPPARPENEYQQIFSADGDESNERLKPSIVASEDPFAIPKLMTKQNTPQTGKPPIPNF
ncbi:DUF3631 domain-containing protein [Comamonas koreensis]|uniref:DUF3631 domain-containing protein n=1 Tax=Comamonas koreensis TaxID=160825 RepID=UPI0015FBC1C7|nr:DUF3631 domain-containing protein [Comamonas koreensis]